MRSRNVVEYVCLHVQSGAGLARTLTTDRSGNDDHTCLDINSKCRDDDIPHNQVQNAIQGESLL